MPSRSGRGFIPPVVAALALACTAAAAADHDWMKGIAGTTPLSQLTVPGTHNTGARVEPLAGTAQCQDFSIAEQLNFGVRFLDIRCRHVADAFAIYHGSIDQNLTFAEVLDQVFGFLDANPSECVIMSVKEEHTPSGTTRSFEATFDSYVAVSRTKWSLDTRVPTLDSVRGTILLFRRFGATRPKGIDATQWPDNTAFQQNGLNVQDYYQVSSNAGKWTQITNALSAAFSDSNPDVLHLNFTSGYQSGLFGIPRITAVSDTINPLLAGYFARAAPGHYGCVLMDFADAHRTQLIYRTNPVATAQPILQSLEVSESDLRISWTTTPDATYRLESTPDMNPSSWTIVPGEIPGAGDTSSTITPLTLSHQFYRIGVLPGDFSAVPERPSR